VHYPIPSAKVVFAFTSHSLAQVLVPHVDDGWHQHLIAMESCMIIRRLNLAPRAIAFFSAVVVVIIATNWKTG